MTNGGYVSVEMFSSLVQARKERIVSIVTTTAMEHQVEMLVRQRMASSMA